MKSFFWQFFIAGNFRQILWEIIPKKRSLQTPNTVVIFQRSTRKRFLNDDDRRRAGDTMMTHKIRLRLDEVNDFVAAASACDFDVDISYNSFVVDAKSIVGVLGLDLNQILTVSCNGYDAEFDKYISRFAIAC